MLFRISRGPGSETSDVRQVKAAVNGEPMPFESGARSIYRSPGHYPSKQRAAADALLLTHTRAFTRVSQHMLPLTTFRGKFCIYA